MAGHIGDACEDSKLVLTKGQHMLQALQLMMTHEQRFFQWP